MCGHPGPSASRTTNSRPRSTSRHFYEPRQGGRGPWRPAQGLRGVHGPRAPGRTGCRRPGLCPSLQLCGWCPSSRNASYFNAGMEAQGVTSEWPVTAAVPPWAGHFCGQLGGRPHETCSPGPLTTGSGRTAEPSGGRGQQRPRSPVLYQPRRRHGAITLITRQHSSQPHGLGPPRLLSAPPPLNLSKVSQKMKDGLFLDPPVGAAYPARPRPSPLCPCRPAPTYLRPLPRQPPDADTGSLLGSSPLAAEAVSLGSRPPSALPPRPPPPASCPTSSLRRGLARGRRGDSQLIISSFLGRLQASA